MKIPRCERRPVIGTLAATIDNDPRLFGGQSRAKLHLNDFVIPSAGSRGAAILPVI